MQWILETLPSGIKQFGYEVDHSVPSSSEFNYAWSYTSAPQYIFKAWCLFKHRDNFSPFLTYIPSFEKIRGSL
jgi:hypothetical protein